VWFPIAQSDQFQQVKIVSKSGDLPVKETSEPEYGNKLFYAHTDKADKTEYHFSVKYDVVRLEHLARFPPSRSQRKIWRRFLQADKLVPITGKPAEIAVEQVKPGMPDMEKARALYDYPLPPCAMTRPAAAGVAVTPSGPVMPSTATVRLPFVFISMVRSQKIPARFEMGLPLPDGQNSGQIAGYHCWAQFYTRERGWFPVDISEAWKHQEKKDYFFGAHDVNRVQFTVGRDLELSPKQHGKG